MTPGSCLPKGYIHVYDHHLQRSLKPLGQSKPNFVWSINGPGHMTKMAATPIYGKNLQKSNCPMIMKLGMLYKVYINDDPELTLTYLTTMSISAKLFVPKVGPDIR